MEWHTAPDLPPTPGRYMVTVSLGGRRRAVIAKWPGNGSKRWVLPEDSQGQGFVIAWAFVPGAYDGPMTAPLGMTTAKK